MNLHHLKYFLTIAEEGSISAASKKLLVGQPALSAQLKQFEDWLGMKLFERSGKKLLITPSGEYVLKYAKAIKNLEDELLLNMPHIGDVKKKELILGAQETVPKSVIARTIATIGKVSPVRFKILEGTGEELFKQLDEGKIDFFISNFKPLSTGKEMFYTSLGKDNVSVWGEKKFISLKKNFPQSLEGSHFIVSGLQSPIRHDFEKFMLQSGVSFEISIEAQDTALQQELASMGEGLIVLGEQAAMSLAKSGKLVKIGSLPGLHEQFWLGMAKKSLDNSYIKSVIKAF